MSERPQTFRQTLPSLDRIFRRFLPLMAKHRALVGGSVTALFISTFLKLLEPWPLKIVFDRVLHSSTYRAQRWAFIPWLDSLKPTNLIIVASLAIVVITTLRALSEYLNTVGFALIGNRVLREVRDMLYRHLQRLSLSFHTGARTGDLTIRVVSDVNMLRDVSVTAILPLLANCLILIGMWSMMLLIRWDLALLALVTVPVLIMRTMNATAKIRDAARKQRQREGEMASTAAESISSIKLVQSLSLEDVFADQFAKRNSSAQQQDVRNARLTAGLERSVDILLAVATGMVLFYGSSLVVNRELTAGDLIIFLTYLKRAFNPVQDFAKYTGRLAKAAAAGDRVLNLLDRKPDVQDAVDAIDAPALTGVVRFENVSFEYEKDRPVLREIDLEVAPGQCVAIVGPSGGGKSTLASLIGRLYDPTSGSILIDGTDIRDYKVQSLRTQISVVLQETLLFAATVRENIGYAAPLATAAEIRSAALLANADEFICELPAGYETVLGERGMTLSGGQRQRLAVARAAVRQAPILVLDEPTAALDEANAQLVARALQKLSQGRTTFYITHDLSQAAFADCVLYVDGGRIIERGSHDELLAANGAYANLYRSQSAAKNHHPRPLVDDAPIDDAEVSDAFVG